MGLELKIGGIRNPHYELTAESFTYDVLGAHTTAIGMIDANTRKGILGGSLLQLEGSLSVGPAKAIGPTASNTLVGFCYRDVNFAKDQYEYSPEIASNKVTLVHGYADLAIDVYETHTDAGAAQTYAVNNKLYCSRRGLVTKDATYSAKGQVGYVLSPPDPTTGEMIIRSILP